METGCISYCYIILHVICYIIFQIIVYYAILSHNITYYIVKGYRYHSCEVLSTNKQLTNLTLNVITDNIRTITISTTATYYCC